MAAAASGVEETEVLARRVVIMLCLCDGVLFRTKRFVPDYRYTTALVGNRNADEVVVIDVTPAERRQEQRHLFYDALERYAATCFSPIAVGGGIRTVEEARQLIALAADKIVIGCHRLLGSFPNEVVDKLGRQALVAAVNHQGSDLGTERARFWSRFAGEILMNSIERDGSLQGYDLEALRAVADVDVPVMVAGGCGTWAHMAAAFEAGASAACTSVIHHLTETSLAACKTWLAANCAQPVREAVT